MPIRRIRFLYRVLAAGLFWGVFVCSGSATGADLPNIVILLSDDAGYADFGFQGSSEFETPNLDELAEAGVVFSNAYAASPVCSPSRAGILTGRSPPRYGMQFNLPGDRQSGVDQDQRGLPVDELTIAQFLGNAGYTTGFAGKWHLGTHPRFRPERRGFDEYLGVLAGFSDYRAGRARATRSYPDPIDPRTLPYSTDAFGDFAVAFIERHRRQPFFLYAAFTAPHPPMHARADDFERFADRFSDENRRKNAAMVYRMDANIGRIVSALKRHGVYHNTLIFFTNDNGGGGRESGSSNGTLRGGKGTVLEGGLRVPFILHWPRRISTGAIVDAPVSATDILPTLAGAAGLMLPVDRAYDGVDLLDGAQVGAAATTRGDLRWRANWASALRRGDWKLVVTPEGESWLFDLASDPGETTDLAAVYPGILLALQFALDQWQAGLPAPYWTQPERWKRQAMKGYDPVGG